MTTIFSQYCHQFLLPIPTVTNNFCVVAAATLFVHKECSAKQNISIHYGVQPQFCQSLSPVCIKTIETKSYSLENGGSPLRRSKIRKQNLHTKNNDDKVYLLRF